MKKVLLIAASLMIAGSMSQVLAGPACCPASKAKAAKAAKAECGTTCMDGLELTAEQQEKIAALKADCAGTECDETSAKKMKSGVKEILTADQLATLKANCDEKGCSLSAKADKADAGNQS